MRLPPAVEKEKEMTTTTKVILGIAMVLTVVVGSVLSMGLLLQPTNVIQTPGQSDPQPEPVESDAGYRHEPPAIRTSLDGVEVRVGGEDNYSYGERVDLAGAVWITEAENYFSDLTIRVHHLDDRSTWTGPTNHKSPGIVMFYTSREVDPVTGSVTETNYEGFSGSDSNKLSFDRSLAGAKATFSLTVWGYRCVYEAGGPGGGGPQGILEGPVCEDLPEAIVDGDIEWTGSGPVVRDVSSSTETQPPTSMFGVHSVSALRNATVVGTIAGDGLVLAQGEASSGILLRGKYHEHYVGAGRV